MGSATCLNNPDVLHTAWGPLYSDRGPRVPLPVPFYLLSSVVSTQVYPCLASGSPPQDCIACGVPPSFGKSELRLRGWFSPSIAIAPGSGMVIQYNLSREVAQNGGEVLEVVYSFPSSVVSECPVLVLDSGRDVWVLSSPCKPFSFFIRVYTGSRLQILLQLFSFPKSLLPGSLSAQFRCRVHRLLVVVALLVRV